MFVIQSQTSQVKYFVEEEFFNGAVDRLGKTLGFFTAIGTTQDISGQVVIDLNSPSIVKSGTFQVNADTLTSDDARRDQKVQEEYLLSKEYPVITFEITGVEGLSAGYQNGTEVKFRLIGSLTILAAPQPVVFDVSAVLNGAELTGEASAVILLTDFGISPPEIPNFMTVSNEVTVVVNFTAVVK